MIKCIAIDDEPLALELLSDYCKDVSFLELQKTFTRTSEALAYMKKNPIDLLFLDIQMPDISGIDFYKSLEEKTMVIFTTAYTQYAVEGFELNAVDYLLKPYDKERFAKAANKAKEFYEYTRKSLNDTNFIFVRADYSLVKINCDEILYIESIDDYIRIHLQDKKPIMTLSTLKAIEEKLPDKYFIRIHRSYIVSLNKISAVRGKNILVVSTELPLSAKYEEAFYDAYTGKSS
jgi:DNA-binding LytR/AlgR family response regulator